MMTDDHAEKNGDPTPPQIHRAINATERHLPISEEERVGRLQHWDETVRKLATMTDETDTDELWDEVLRNLGVDPITGGGIGS